MWRVYTLPLLFLSIFAAIDCLQLSEHIGHYETLDYDQNHLRERHSRTRRSVYDKIIHLNITAFHRLFKLRLHPDTETFHPEATEEVNGVEQRLDTSHLFQGVVEGHAGSKVVGAITDGVFQGQILLPNGDNYHVERKEHYVHNKDLNSNVKAHSVIYHDDSVDLDKFYRGIRERRSAEGKTGTGFCGNSYTSNTAWMDEVKRSASEGAGSSYTHKDGDNPYLSSPKDFSYHRNKRSATKTTCNLFLQSDQELWKYYQTIFTAAASEEQLREEISTLFQQHVQKVNEIYTATTFRENSGSTPYFNHGFRVDKLRVNMTCKPGESITNPFCSSNIDASNLLNLNSFRNHNDFCLAYLFTYRDFDGGTLGLAWVAEPGKVGGICSTYGNSRGGGDVRGTRSLNTGIITLNNYRKRVPPRVSHLTFAHELGHNFGSTHDKEGENPSCAPYTDRGDNNGNFIMFASATTGTKKNNEKFSSCSNSLIARVLNSVVNNLNSKINCFKEAAGAWCGNQIFEGGDEQCDCGYEDTCLKGDLHCCKCCHGRSDSNAKTTACKLKPGKLCDPSQGPCCHATCGYEGTNVMCRPDDACTKPVNCTGAQPHCPTPVHKANGSICNNMTQICAVGECTGSICERINSTGKPWISCEPESNDKDPTALCFVSCAADNKTKCYSSASVGDKNFPVEFKQLLDSNNNNGTKIKMPPGHICDKERGFCDHFQKCRKVNGKGPLARLKDLLFNASTLKKIKEWVTVYWYAVALSIIGFITLMVLFVKCCAVHTPSSNPKKPPARSLSKTLTLRRRQQGQSGAAARDPGQRQTSPAERPPAYSSVITEQGNQPMRGQRSSNQPQGQRPKKPQQGQSKEQRRQQYEMQQQHLKRNQR